MNSKKTLDSAYFKGVYDANDDPWNFETSRYEAEKYAVTIASLPQKKYKKTLEIGCSIGVLTALLAQKTEHLLATDVSEKALEKAKERCKDLENVEFRLVSFPREMPNDRYDLIMISEVAYYLSPEDWENAITKLYDLMLPNGNIMLVHWLPEVHDYPQTGDEVHETFEKMMKDKLVKTFSRREENYRLDVWTKDSN